MTKVRTDKGYVTATEVRQIVVAELIPLKVDIQNLKENVNILADKIDWVRTQLDKLVKMMVDYRAEQSGNQIQHDDFRTDIDGLKNLHPNGQHLTI